MRKETLKTLIPSIIILATLGQCMSFDDAVVEVKDLAIAGTITKKYTLRFNRNSKELDFTNSVGTSNHIMLLREKSGFWDYVKVGDSIVKSSGSFKIHIYREHKLDRKFVLKYY